MRAAGVCEVAITSASRMGSGLNGLIGDASNEAIFDIAVHECSVRFLVPDLEIRAVVQEASIDLGSLILSNSVFISHAPACR